MVLSNNFLKNSNNALNNFKTEIKINKKFNNATKQRPQGEHIMDATLVTWKIQANWSPFPSAR